MDSISITILFIAFSAVVGAFMAGRVRDACLMDWAGDAVTVTFKDGKTEKGVLRLEATGFEVVYQEDQRIGKDGYPEKSFMLYKNEYPVIAHIVRCPRDMGGKSRKKRDRFLQKGIYHRMFVKLRRNIRNFFATVRDSAMEVVNLFIGRAKTYAQAGRVLSEQDRHVSRIKDSTFSALTHSFEPLIEKHLGKYVILESERDGDIFEYRGILKDYTRDFIELMDVDLGSNGEFKGKKIDVIVPRAEGAIRHLSG